MKRLSLLNAIVGLPSTLSDLPLHEQCPKLQLKPVDCPASESQKITLAHSAAEH